jgi:hypothetical protein
MKVADEMCHDGDPRQTALRCAKLGFDGIEELCIARGARRDLRAGEGGFSVMVFPDGSAIVEINGAWDARPEGCERHCWFNSGCQCVSENENERVVVCDGDLCLVVDGPGGAIMTMDVEMVRGRKAAVRKAMREDASVGGFDVHEAEWGTCGAIIRFEFVAETTP